MDSLDHLTVQLFATDQPTIFAMTLTSDVDTTILRHNTPLDVDLFACNSFTVTDAMNLNSVPHTGAIGKRKVTEESWLTMVAGESITNYVDLSYCFEFHTGRHYHLQLDHAAHEKNGSQLKLQTHEKLTFVSPTHSKVRMADKLVEFSNCDTSTTTEGLTAIENALAGVGAAVTELESCANDAYVRFFGAYDEYRYCTLMQNFANIYDALENEDFSVVCGDSECEDSVFAFVYRADTDHNIYVCGAYDSAAVELGWDSKPGTIIHELSHFSDIADTDDHQYGVSGCEALAVSNPCQAFNNADSHEYFVEQRGEDDWSTTTTECFDPQEACATFNFDYGATCDDDGAGCTSHMDCDTGDYCDYGGSCYSFDVCSVFDDAIDGVCPECNSHQNCDSDEYCDHYYVCDILENCNVFDDAVDGSCPYDGAALTQGSMVALMLLGFLS
jgi:hypothetical protein